MVRIMIKGGIWKNTEDEILKAAVMKYGLNQWSRISSLLVRKSAKQCKARWYEWLDPNIKKTEWTREEDEKLLHLAKLFPTQWRTIAPHIGRTPAQCLDRYERLLDMAQGKEHDENDPRRLKPGEIDPNPETKAPKPDPIDMDDDEKEMLSEARARLANTKGKKAKRKAREKQLEEAKRLVMLQKRRELKAAGIIMRGRKRKRDIDYNAEVPLERKPPPGLYDTPAEEEPAADPRTVSMNLFQLEGKRRDQEEAQKRKADQKRFNRLKEANLPAAIMAMEKANEVEHVRKRSKLMLPEPQLTDRGLEEVVKLSQTGDLPALEYEGSGATKNLLASYSAAGMTPTPMRTPKTQDTVLLEARNAIALSKGSNVLEGGENAPLVNPDFSGVAPSPSKRFTQTPNAILTPSRNGAGGSTPGRSIMTPGGPVGLTPGRTPVRDSMGLNQQQVAELDKHRQALLRNKMKAGLSQLPAPKNEYKIVMPDLPPEEEEEEKEQEMMEEDMAEVLERQRQMEAEVEAREMRLRSQAIQRELPRPLALSLDMLLSSSVSSAADGTTSLSKPQLQAKRRAEEILGKEVLALVQNDAIKYPLPNARVPKKAPVLDSVTEEELKAAHEILEQEVTAVKTALGHGQLAASAVNKAFDEIYNEYMYLPSAKKYGKVAAASRQEKVEAYEQAFELIRNELAADIKKCQKLENKLKVTNGGYIKREEALLKQIDEQYKALEQLNVELKTFQVLQATERTAAIKRTEKMSAELEMQESREDRLQSRYGALAFERDRLQKILAEGIQPTKEPVFATEVRVVESQ